MKSGLSNLSRSIGVALAVGLAIVLILPESAAAQAVPEGVGFDQNLGGQIPLDLTFQDENDDTVTLRSYFGGKPVILMPVYYKCPMLCGLELNGFVRCLRGLRLSTGMIAETDFEIVTFSIDHRENAHLAGQKRKQYLAQYDAPAAENGWHFLTGSEDQIQRLCESIGFRTKYDEVSGQYAHAAGIVVCTPDGIISRYLYGVEFAPRDLRLSVLESSKGEIGSLAEHVLMFCYRYDPTQGKYGLAILNILRAGGILTVLLLAGSIFWMLRRERHAMQGQSLLEGASHG
jgi:protein SCO1/2